MSAPTADHSPATGGFAYRVTATDGNTHLTHGPQHAAGQLSGVFRTLCLLDATQAPVFQAGRACPWCEAVASHLELADPLRVAGDGRVRRFLAELTAGTR